MATSPARSGYPSRNTNESAEASAGIEPAMRVLQTLALPLGDDAGDFDSTGARGPCMRMRAMRSIGDYSKGDFISGLGVVATGG